MTITRSTRLRIVAVLLICLGGAGFGFAWIISGWPHPAGDPTSYVVPGGNGTAKAEIIPLLTQLGGGIVGFAVALLFLAQILGRRDRLALEAGDVTPARPKPHPFRTTLATVIAVVLALGGTFGYQWYSYVTAGLSPYDEVGISINSALPRSLRVWGCAQMEPRFPGALPPLGCGDASGLGWISNEAQ
jgi:hypothetical protein